MASNTDPAVADSAKPTCSTGDLPAEITLRFGGLRLRGCVHWPQAIPVGQRSPLIFLLADGRDRPAADALTATLCSSAEAVVLSVTSFAESAPGEPVSADLELAALGWAAEHAAELSANPDGLVVAGVNAAGAHAARLAIAARDSAWPELSRQLLVHPAFTAADPMPSDVAGVAPATIAVAARGDGRRYAAVLRAAGVDVEELRCAGHRLPDGRRLARFAPALQRHRAR
jgi:acetyl esterase/lipase